MREKGRVKFYNKETGFGFIKTKKGDVHFSRDSFKGEPPQEGDWVEFDVVIQSRCFHAKNIKIIFNKFLPDDTKKLLKHYPIENFNLKLNKFAYFEYFEDKFILFKKDKNMVAYKVTHEFNKKFFNNIVKSYYSKLKKINLNFEEVEMKLQWRMIIGFGSPSVYETSMILHHIYGFPYIPAQAIKGVVRNYVIQEEFNCREDDALKDKEFCDVFGGDSKSYYKQATKGEVIFFDAYPLDSPKIDIDVMNVHYKDYYDSKGEVPPADYQSPTPIYFLVVRDTRFKILLGSSQKDLANYKIKEKNIIAWLQDALYEHGVGAKTSIGYGVMES